MTIDYSQIFRIGEDGIYYQDGITFYFEFCKDKDGFAGERIFCDGKFLVKFYSQSNFTVEFNINSFKNEIDKINNQSSSLEEGSQNIESEPIDSEDFVQS